MTVETVVTRGKLIRGTDQVFRVTCYATDASGLNYGDSGYVTTAQSMSGWALELVLRKHQSDGLGAAVLTVSSATLSSANGTNDRAAFAIADTDTDNLTPGTYDWAAYRTDAGSETCIAFGTIVLTGAAAQ